MKRYRDDDDVFINSQLKRPLLSSRAESSGEIMGRSNMQRLTTSDALTYLKQVKDIFQDDKDTYDEFIGVMKDFKAQRIDTPGVIRRVKTLFVGHQNLVFGFNTFLPKGYKITLTPEEEVPLLAKKHVQIDDAFSFVGKIKAKLQGDNHVFKSFLRILNMYKMENKSISEVYQEVSELFRDHPDLLSEFTLFLPYESVPATIHDSQAGRDSSRDDWRSPMNVLKSNRGNGIEQHDSDFKLTILRPNNDHSVNAANIRRHDKYITEQGYEERNLSYNGVQHVFCTENNESWNNRQFPGSVKIDDHRRERGDRNKVDRYKDTDGIEPHRYDKGIAIFSQDVSGQKVPIYSREKYVLKSIQELDLSNCETCTPSYRRLPMNYPIPSASQRTDIGAEVLNDHWVSVTSGSEDYSFKHMRKNQYEESLFRCEDDRFEMDMLLESVTSTIKRVEELLEKINANAIDTDPPILIKDHFTALNLRCIERLYGDHGLDVMEVFCKNAPLALPVILTRLKQKQEEWTRCRYEFNKVWAETYAKNHHKSLDHRSFYFKQQDIKGLSTKALLAEIKDISDGQKQLMKKDVVLSTVVESKHPIIPHMEFMYPDADIHEDLYQLVKYSCGELCSAELLDKVMKIWTTFLESVLGVPSRPEEGAEDIHNVDKDNSEHNGVGAEDFNSNCTTIANDNPSYISSNRVDHTTTEHSTPTRECLVNGINRASERHDSADVIEEKSQSVCDTPQDEMMPGANVLNEASVIGKQATPGEQLANSSIAGVEKFSGPSSATIVSSDITVERGLNMHVSDGSKVPVCTKSVPSSSERVTEGSGAQECHKGSMSDIKAEREEGELSPNEDTGLDNSEAYGSSVVDILSKPQSCMVNRHYKMTHGDGISVDAGEHADGGGEHASHYVDFSPDSAGAEDCSPEEPDEDVDHNKNENNVKSEYKDGVEDAHNIEADGARVPLSDSFLDSARPLTRHVPAEQRDMDNGSQIFYGNDSFYVLFRLHQMLYERIGKAKLYSSSAEKNRRVSNDINPASSYARFINALHSLLDGSSDNARFEDECRSIIGTQSYILFTLEKLIYKLVKQLQAIATEDVEMRLIQLYAYEKSRNPASFADVVYRANARFLLSEGSKIYRIDSSSTPLRLSIQLMDNGHDKPGDAAVHMDPNFADYLYGDVLSSDVPKEEKRGIYLKRNKRKYLQGDANNALSDSMDGVIMINSLESQIKVSTSKVDYARGSEDFMYRMRKRRETLYRYASYNGQHSNGRPVKQSRSILFS